MLSKVENCCPKYRKVEESWPKFQIVVQKLRKPEISSQ